MDSARHAIKHILIPHFLSRLISYDAVSTDSARHTIERILNPRFLSSLDSYDVASTIHQSLSGGEKHSMLCAEIAPIEAGGLLRTSTRQTLNILILLRAVCFYFRDRSPRR
jgi:hypothetical protein